MEHTTDVVIVGAGPTGLSAAIALAQAGVGVTVVERDAGPIEQSRAVWVHPRTVELWDGLGVAEQALAHGRQLERIDIHPYRAQIGTIWYDGTDRTAFPHGLILEQHVTQRLLLDRLAELGVTPRWERTVTDLAQDADGVTVTVEAPDGRRAQVRTRYVLGADGASSTVRDLVGLSLEGGTYASSFFSTDVVMGTPLERARAHMSLTLAQTHALLPLPGERRWRVVGNFTRAQERRYGGDAGPTGGAELDVDDVRALMASMRIPHTVEAIEWATVYRSHHRLVDRYRVGRVFLAGDAAHIHSPAGGLGMNTGIGDALNVAWKLAAAVDGHARDALLDTYEAERRPVAATVLRTSDRIFRLQAGTGRVVSLLRVVLLPLIPTVLSLTRRGRRLAFAMLSQLGVTYRDAPTTAHAAGRRTDVVAGDRLPYVVLPDGRTSHDLVPTTGLAVVVAAAGGPPGTTHASDPVGDGAATAVTQSDRVHEAPTATDPRSDRVREVVAGVAVPVRVHVLGGARALLDTLGADGPVVVVVRPDGHLAHVGPADDTAALGDVLARWYAPAVAAA